ncbi:glutamate-cysteine ligase family protein [Halobiforma nitratireducens]|uniref:Glutamate--cysteine ligase n=1 Tax=Halobiforma nitratireducens JCM 10879 TaxID=1227454 RepID=M0ML77_9EURY|nr:glutamate-cysteine ligase family protein [Halobiforma nitratireducens]EMA46447.1 hypothetical protein C446_01218 [Halobiforma nitratireducens JCM 10879]
MNASLEVEYWVVDDDGDLVSPGPLLDRSDRIDPEFVEPMIELKTTPCATMDELRTEFRALLSDVVDAAHERGKRLVPLSTPIHAAPAELPYRDKRGTALQRRIVGPTFDDARVCAGTHLHFERADDAGRVADQLNALTAIDPAFALVSSSSHYRGEPIVECARPYLYRRSCYGPCPEQGQLWPYVDSVGEWERRLETAYDRFRNRALEHGVDPDVFDEEFDPYDAVWTPVRLREEMPTVEWRSPDVALPSQIFDLAETVRGIVDRAATRGVTDAGSNSSGGLTLPEFATVERVTDAAIDDGIGDEGVQRYLRRFGFTPTAYEPLAERLPDSRVTKRDAKTLRLEAAGQLEREVGLGRARA